MDLPPFYSCCKCILAHHIRLGCVHPCYHICNSRSVSVHQRHACSQWWLDSLWILTGYFHVFARSRSSCWRSIWVRVWEEYFLTIWSLIISSSRLMNSQDFANSLKLVRCASNIRLPFVLAIGICSILSLRCVSEQISVQGGLYFIKGPTLFL